MPPGRDPFANFERMRREMDELFGDVFSRTGFAPRQGFSPRVDVYYAGDPPRAVVKADLAGVDPDEVGLEVRGRELTIVGERRPQRAEGRVFQQVEIPHGRFRRVVGLGADVLADEARATYEDGILRVEIPVDLPSQRARPVSIEARRGAREEARLGDGEEP
ncbi:MAG: Hsp20/alpha crystallin family protein [Thermoleophilaceae bacterium]